jgi:hypothetical protein
MDKTSIYRGHIKRFYNQIKKPDTCPSKKCNLIKSLEKACFKYIIQLAHNDTIQWQDYYSIIDVLTDNINCLKEKVKA